MQEGPSLPAQRTAWPGAAPELARCFEGHPPERLLRWAFDTFGDRVCLACSFGAEDMALVHMGAGLRPGLPVVYLDTGLLFEATYQLIREVEQRYPVRLVRVAPELGLDEQARRFGDCLWATRPDLCCQLRKVRPLRRFLQAFDAWITGIRREQSPTRAGAQVVEWDPLFGLFKLNPLAGWSWQDLWGFIRRHRIPHNPMHHQGYPSIGCWPCTTPVEPGEHPRSGRWRGTDKTECGLHGRPVGP